MLVSEAITKTDIKELRKLFSGKVRDVYEVSENQWLMVTTDRISAFDVVFNEGIPDKGMILNKISNKWFSEIKFLPNHIISTQPQQEFPFLNSYPGLPERSVLVKKVKRIPVECVVRGYLFGSAYEEYLQKNTVCGNPLPKGLNLAQKLSEPIFTPSTKAEIGHDENIDHRRFFDMVGKSIGASIMEASSQIYQDAHNKMEKAGIILADTKFEFGLDENGHLTLVDEVLTPDSSRYWDASSYKIGTSPKSYDKQFVRDYLNTLDWDKKPPAPSLPLEIIDKTREKYIQLLKVIEKI